MLGWSAPEAAAGFATPASDRYALALLTFFAIVGSPWHSVLRGGDGKSPDSSRPPRIASERAKALGGTLDPALDAWFEKALAASPEGRFESSRRMLQAFIEALWGGATLEAPARSASPKVDPIAATTKAAPVSLPGAGPEYWSTLQMGKPDPIVTDPTDLATGATDPAPRGSKLPASPSLPLSWRLAVAGVALAFVVLAFFLWRR
jgi:hypothetical protein